MHLHKLFNIATLGLVCYPACTDTAHLNANRPLWLASAQVPASRSADVCLTAPQCDKVLKKLWLKRYNFNAISHDTARFFDAGCA